VTLAAGGSTFSASGPPCYSALVNDWICPAYVSDRRTEIADALLEHVLITLAAVALGFVLALPLALVARRYTAVESAIVAATTIIYTVPSLALFALLVNITALSPWTVIIGLALYTLTILVRNMLAGLRDVPADVKESAVGLGYGPGRLLLRVELPLALPVIMAGLRVATVSTVALTTVGTLVAYGGLGDLLSNGIRTDFKSQILTASVLCVALAVVFDALLMGTQRVLTPWARGRK
jgi:osmoprotectant transport system permease protein